MKALLPLILMVLMFFAGRYCWRELSLRERDGLKAAIRRNIAPIIVILLLWGTAIFWALNGYSFQLL